MTHRFSPEDPADDADTAHGSGASGAAARASGASGAADSADAVPEPGDSGDTSAPVIAEIRKGIADTWAIGLGLIPLGLPFGLLIVQSGFAWWWAPIFSFVIYAGSMEYLAINLVTSGIGLLSAAITGFMVNFRHAFYGLTFPRERIKNPVGIAYSTYALTDETYAITSTVMARERNISGARILTIQVFAQALWVLSGLTGAVVGQYIPTIEGMSFALVALFVVLGMESFKSNPDWSLPFLALACAALGWCVSSQSMMVIGLALYLVVVLIRFFLPTVDRWLTWKGGNQE